MCEAIYNAAQCVLRAMVKNIDKDIIFSVAIYSNRPSLLPKHKISGIAGTEESELAEKIQRAISDNQKDFTYHDDSFEIMSLHIFDNIYKKKNFIQSAYFSFESRIPIYVCKKIMCDNFGHDTEDVLAHVINKKTGREVKFNVEYCFACDKYMCIDKVIYKYIDLGYKLNVRLYPGTGYGDGSSFSHYSPQSLLAANGYSVGKQRGLTAGRRQEILAYMVDNYLMNRYQIADHLSGLIDLRSLRYDADFSDAISKWECDLRFIMEYKSANEREVLGDIIL